MKQELVQLAKDKGFVATFVHDKPFIYSSKEPLRWLFWMTELQKWLRDEYSIHIAIRATESGRYCVEIERFKPIFYRESEYFIIYEDALQNGLFEALKLLKDME